MLTDIFDNSAKSYIYKFIIYTTGTSMFMIVTQNWIQIYAINKLWMEEIIFFHDRQSHIKSGWENSKWLSGWWVNTETFYDFLQKQKFVTVWKTTKNTPTIRERERRLQAGVFTAVTLQEWPGRPATQTLTRSMTERQKAEHSRLFPPQLWYIILCLNVVQRDVQIHAIQEGVKFTDKHR